MTRRRTYAAPAVAPIIQQRKRWERLLADTEGRPPCYAPDGGGGGGGDEGQRGGSVGLGTETNLGVGGGCGAGGGWWVMGDG